MATFRHYYCCVPTEFIDETKALIPGVGKSLSCWEYETFTLCSLSYGYASLIAAMIKSCVPHTRAIFYNEEWAPRELVESFYDRDGEHTASRLVVGGEQQVLWCNYLDNQGLRAPLNYRFAHLLSNHSSWGDVKHNTAMARLRAALTQ